MTLDDLRTLSDLETFLGGMETLPAPHRSPGLDGALKPSLVEWKPRGSILSYPHPHLPLKPSLVEWKRSSHATPRMPQSYVQSLKPDGNLETFLGGMETQVAGL